MIGNIQDLCIIFDRLIVDLIVSRIHYKKDNFKILFSMTGKLLKQLAINMESFPPEMQTAIYHHPAPVHIL